MLFVTEGTVFGSTVEGVEVEAVDDVGNSVAPDDDLELSNGTVVDDGAAE
jgi:hypothetical protein